MDNSAEVKTEYDFVSVVQKKYNYMTREDIESVVNKAKMFYFGIKYPCEPYADDTTRPIVNFVDKQWILSACDDIIERAGFSSAIAYKENGISWTFDGATLSDKLYHLLTPVVGVIK